MMAAAFLGFLGNLVKGLAAAELAALPLACQSNDPSTPPGCSHVRTLINDYKHLRDRLRAK